MTQMPGPAFDGLYGQMIMDHYRAPRNRDPLPAPTLAAYELNPFCGDLIDLQLLLDETGTVDGVYANSEGCSIIQASASMMSEAVKGRTAEEMASTSGRRGAVDRPGSKPSCATAPAMPHPTRRRNWEISAPWEWSGSTPSASSAPSSPGPPWSRPSGNVRNEACRSRGWQFPITRRAIAL